MKNGDRGGAPPRRGLFESFSNLGEGIGLLAEGAGFLRRHRSLWILAQVPILFAFLLMSLGLSVYAIQFDSLSESVRGLFPVLEVEKTWQWVWVGPGRVFFGLLRWLLLLLALAALLLMSLLAANLLSAPFLDRLSERVEELALGERGGEPSKPQDGASLWSQALRSFAAESQRMFFLAGVGISLALLGFIVPGAHFVTGPLMIGFTVLFLPLDYAGFALDRRGATFRARREWLGQHRPLMLGFGGLAFLACLIPGVNLFLMPSLVTAGTLLVLRHEPPRSSS